MNDEKYIGLDVMFQQLTDVRCRTIKIALASNPLPH